jgi:hypothetical protein
MRILKIILPFILLFLSITISAQQTCTLSGYVRDAKSGEELIGTIINTGGKSGKLAITNAYGFYSITLPTGIYELKAQHIGYNTENRTINLNSSQLLDFNLTDASNELKEVVVSGSRPNNNITQLQMGMQKLDTKEISNIPVLFGEKDIMKTIQLLPGIKSAGEGNSGFNVRGGAVDQNLIQLDEATVYNASHLMGFFSTFNSDAIKDISVFKGNEPAEYGGRLSSAIDIKTRDGNDKNFGVSGGIGLISSRLNVEGPIVKNKGSFTISARRTYADMFLKLSKDTTLNKAILYFYDFNAKANYRIDTKNRIFLSGYFGRDVLGFGDRFGINWGNATGTFRWNHLFSDKMFSNTSFIYSDYDYKINFKTSSHLNIISRIQDFGLKQDFQYYMSTNSTLKYGINSVYHNMIPGIITSDSNADFRKLTNKHVWENAIYISHQYSFNKTWNVEYGARITSFSLIGAGKIYTYDKTGDVTDTMTYKAGQFIKTYINIEPRATASYLINSENSIKASFSRNTQNMHLLSNSTSGNPTDLWIPSSNNVKPEIADQVSLGFYRNFIDNNYELSVEGYYKSFQNQIDYKNGAQISFNENAESQILFGKGRAYGLEVFLKKKYGRLNGWISYTLSRTERKFDEINNGNYYPAKQDRTHDISIVGIYELNKKITLSATWVFNTGNAVTFPTGKYQVDGITMYYFSERNANRMPDYHRLDLGLTWKNHKTAKFESSWNFSLYNAYGRDNAYTISFRDNVDDPSKTDIVQTTLFKFVPSVTYNFKF